MLVTCIIQKHSHRFFLTQLFLSLLYYDFCSAFLVLVFFCLDSKLISHTVKKTIYSYLYPCSLDWLLICDNMSFCALRT